MSKQYTFVSDLPGGTGVTLVQKDGIKYVQKLITKSRYNFAVAELHALNKLAGNKNCAQLHDVFSESGNVYVILRFIPGGDLHDYINNNGNKSEAELKNIIYQTIEILQLLREKNIIHHDIKLENLMLHESKVVVIDFGCASDQSTQIGLKGTLHSVPPEIANGFPNEYNKNAGFEIDYWCLGILILDLFKIDAFPIDKHPSVDYPRRFLHAIVNDDHNTGGLEGDLLDLVNGLLKKTPNERLGYNSIDDIKRHPYFNEFSERAIKRTISTPNIVPSKRVCISKYNWANTPDLVDVALLANTKNQIEIVRLIIQRCKADTREIISMLSNDKVFVLSMDMILKLKIDYEYVLCAFELYSLILNCVCDLRLKKQGNTLKTHAISNIAGLIIGMLQNVSFTEEKHRIIIQTLQSVINEECLRYSRSGISSSTLTPPQPSFLFYLSKFNFIGTHPGQPPFSWNYIKKMQLELSKMYNIKLEDINMGDLLGEGGSFVLKLINIQTRQLTMSHQNQHTRHRSR